MLLLSVSSVYAYQFDLPWFNQDSYTVALSKYDSKLTDVQSVNQWQTAGWGYIDITDTDESGSVSAGDKFTDYNIYYVTSFKNASNSAVTSGNLNNTTGTGSNAYQITVEAILNGTVTSTGNYTENFTFDSLVSANLYMDSSNDSDGLTLGDFSTASGLSDYLDSDAVLTGTSTVLGSSAGNNGYLAMGSNGQGKYQVAIGIDEVNSYNGFLQDSTGDDLFEKWDGVAMYPDGDLTRLNAASLDESKVEQAFIDHYGFTGNSLQFYTMSSQDGSIDLATIPEPTTLILFGIGLLSLAGITRKKIS